MKLTIRLTVCSHLNLNRIRGVAILWMTFCMLELCQYTHVFFFIYTPHSSTHLCQFSYASQTLPDVFFPCGHIPSSWETYSKAHEIYAWFLLCCVLFCVVSTKFIHPHWKLFSPYPSGLLCWLWGNHMIAPMPVKQSWRIWLLAVRYDLNRGLPMCLLFIMYQGYIVICIFMNLM